MRYCLHRLVVTSLYGTLIASTVFVNCMHETEDKSVGGTVQFLSSLIASLQFCTVYIIDSGLESKHHLSFREYSLMPSAGMLWRRSFSTAE